MTSVVRWTATVLLWLVILAALSVLAVMVVIPRIGGATPYTILTGSMRPGMPPGTLVVSRPVAPEQIRVGTVITYQLRSGEPEVVTHRVIAQGVREDGELIFRTQGDANPSPDPEWVRAVQVRGERWYAMPYLGRLNVLITGRQHGLLVYAVAAALGIYAGTMIVGGLIDRVRRPAARRALHEAS